MAVDPLLEYSQSAPVKSNQQDAIKKVKTVDPLLEYSMGTPAEKAEPSLVDEAKEVVTNVAKAPVELVKYFVEPSSPEAGKAIKAEELQALADKYKGKISPEALGNFAIGMGGSLEKSNHPIMEKLIGVGLEGVGAGIVPFAAKKLGYSDNPEAKAAIDELRTLVDERKTKGQVAAELASGLLVPGGIAAKGASRAARIAAPIAAGSAMSLGSSKEGQEVKSAIQGGLLGGYLHGLSAGAVKGVKALKELKANPKEPKIIEQSKLEFTPEKADRIEQAIKERASTKDTVTPYIEDAIEGRPSIVRDEDVSRILESRPEAASEVISEILKKSDDSVDQALLQKTAAERLLNDEVGEFARYLEESETIGGRKYERPANAAEAIQTVVKTEGSDFVKEAYRRFKEGKAAQEVFDEGIVERLPESKQNVKAVRDFMLNARYPYRFLDRKLGTKIEASMDKLTNRMNLYSLKVDNVLDKVADFGKQLEAAKLDANEVPSLIETGRWKSLPEPQKNVVSNIVNYQEALRKQANELGLPIQGRDNYVRHATVSAPEYIAKIADRGDKLGVNLAEGVTQKQFQELFKNTEGREFVQALTIGKGAQPKNAAEFNILLKQSLDPQAVSERINNFAAAAQKREGEIPNFVRETNILKLMKGWGENTFRHAYFRQPLAELKQARNQAAAAGDKYGAEYINKHLGQILGTPSNNSNFASWTKKQRTKFQADMLKEADNATGNKRLLYKFAAESPEILHFLGQQVYPNFIAMNPKSVLLNLVQPLMMSVPEVGWIKGGGMLLKGYSDLVHTKMVGKVIKLSPEMAEKLGKPAGSVIKTRDLSVILGNEGVIPSKSFNHEVEKYITDGINKTTKGMPRRAVEKINELGMYFFETAELANRYAVKQMGEELAKEAFKNGGKSKTLDRILPPGYKRELRGKTLEESKALVSNYLVNKTMLSYNRAELSQFGRAFGSLLAQFSKFPSSVMGDVVDIVQSKGAGKGSLELLRKYIAPAYALSLLGDLQVQEYVEENPAAKKLLGSKGLGDMAVIGAVKNLTTAGMVPPHLKNSLEIIQAMLEGSPQKGWKSFNNVVQSTIPGGWTLRFLGSDLPAYRGQEPEKGTFLQKALRGAGLDESSLDDYVEEIENKRRGRN